MNVSVIPLPEQVKARQLTIMLLTAILLTLTGCASLTETSTPPVTVSDVIQMSDEGLPARQIIERMRQSGTVYRLNASQLANLEKRGVSGAVINYMQRTYLHAVRRNQALRDDSYWTLGDDGYWYGGIPYGWSDDVSYVGDDDYLPENDDVGDSDNRGSDDIKRP